MTTERLLLRRVLRQVVQELRRPGERAHGTADLGVMNLLYLLLPVGIALLAVPTAVICGAKIRERLDQPARRHSEGILPLLRCRFNF